LDSRHITEQARPATQGDSGIEPQPSTCNHNSLSTINLNFNAGARDLRLKLKNEGQLWLKVES